MKTRIIVAVIFVPLIFVVLFFLPGWAVTALMAAIAAVGSYELIRALGTPSTKRLYVYAAVSAVLIPAAAVLNLLSKAYFPVLFLLLAVIFIDAVLTYKTEKEITLCQVAAAFFGGAVLPLLLTAVIGLKLHDQGRYYVLIPFIIAFITDAGAYFTGVFFGKHQAFPRVSPHKTVEGCIGGITTGIAMMAVYGVILHTAAGLDVSFPVIVLYGLVGGLATELGDLAFSLIKRVTGIKDYGSLLPGHGGILDRFDSMFFAAPVVYLLAGLLPAF